MDIEGTEFRILNCLSPSTLSEFRIIVLEIHELRVLQEPILKLFTLSIFASLLIKFYRLCSFFVYYPSFARAFRVLGSYFEPYLLLKTIKKLSLTQTPVHAHPNNCCGSFIEFTTSMNFGYGMEFIFLRNDRFDLHQPLIHPVMPHPLDRDNMPNNPSLNLNTHWKRPS